MNRSTRTKILIFLGFLLLIYLSIPYIYFSPSLTSEPTTSTAVQASSGIVIKDPKLFTFLSSKRIQHDGKMVVLIVIGTRPEIIKMAPIIWEVSKHPDMVGVVVNTGQHKDLIQGFLQLFSIKVDILLHVINDGLSSFNSQITKSMDQVLDFVKPNIVLVQGDTSSAMMSALTAFHRKIPIGHVEAGLRTYDLYSPFPEEMNRQIIGTVTSFHFAPSETSRSLLLEECIRKESVHTTGNTVIDTFLWMQGQKESAETRELFKGMNLISVFQKVDLKPPPVGVLKEDSTRVVLLTSHRRENHGPNIESILEAAKYLVEQHPNLHIVFPVHPNPNVQKAAEKVKGVPRIYLSRNFNYEELAYLIKHSYFLLTDSGGLQEEATALGKPVLVLRTNTERPEGVKAGVTKLIGTNKQDIITEVNQLLSNEDGVYEKMSKKVFPYGDGTASLKIVNILLENKEQILANTLPMGKDCSVFNHAQELDQ